MSPLVRILLAGVAFVPVVACESGDSSPNTSTPNDGGASTGVDGGPTAQDGGSARRDGGDDASAPQKDADTSDPLATSFVFVGCNRLQKADWDQTQNPSSANVAQLQQTFADIGAMPDMPKRFFFTGDMVLALKSGTTDLSSQLDAWAALWNGGPIAKKVDLLPMPGNHEMLYKDKSSGLELANVGADDVFVKWLAAQGFDAHAGNGPTNVAPNADALMDDQSRLSYSFDDGAVHFVVLDTDTWTSTQDPSTSAGALGWIALHWLQGDLKAAQANAAITSIFVLGHKPIVSPSGVASGSEAIYPSLTSALTTALDETPKVKGYFSAHAHLWDSRKLPGTRGVAQIIAGNGGSQLDTGGVLTSDTYGFTEARVYRSGKVGIVSWQRPAPTPYNAATTQKAVPAAESIIAQ